MKTCIRCKQSKPATADFFHRSKRYADGLYYYCRDCSRRIHQTSRRKNKIRWNERERARYRRDIEAQRARSRAKNFRIRTETLTAYGGSPPRCACCGETEFKFLSLDHVVGGGADDRRRSSKEGGGAGWVFYAQLKKRGYPAGFQVLCMNCNSAKGFWGVCPHEEKRVIRPHGG